MEAKMDATIRAILEGYFGKGSVEDVIDDLHREIYKAGQDSVLDSMPENLPPLLETAHRSGIKEVVEWMESVPTRKIDGAEQYICTLEQWQAKLKSWHISA